MGTDFAIDVEPRQPPAIAITDDELEQHYRVHVPSGEPPLAAIREHVARAIAMERTSTEPDPIAVLHARFVDEHGRTALWFDPNLETVATARGVTPLSRFLRSQDGEVIAPGDYVFDSEEEERAWIAEQQAERQRHVLAHGPDRERWCEPADGLRTIRVLRETASDDVLACLALVEQILVIAEREQRRWRLLAFR
jgi:hypothetical protein